MTPTVTSSTFAPFFPHRCFCDSGPGCCWFFDSLMRESVQKVLATDGAQMHTDGRTIKSLFHLCGSVPHLWLNPLYFQRRDSSTLTVRNRNTPVAAMKKTRLPVSMTPLLKSV